MTLNCSATNGAGLTGSNSVTVKIDTTPPTVTANRSSCQPGVLWLVQYATGRPTVTFTCTDTGSGIPTGGCPGAVNVADGKNQTISSGGCDPRRGQCSRARDDFPS